MGLEFQLDEEGAQLENSWRNSVTHDNRTKIVKRIMDTLQRHKPIAGQDGEDELLKLAWRFEEKIFQAATDQQDYLRKISLKMLSLEIRGNQDGRTLDLNEAAAELGVTRESGEENGEVINERA